MLPNMYRFDQNETRSSIEWCFRTYPVITKVMAAARPLTWLITGASSGFGKALALETLRAGYKVIGTTRDVGKAEVSFPEFKSKGGIWLELDPAQKDAYEQFSKCSQEHDVDVLVNNAGYAFVGGVEDTSEDEVRDQMEVNFYGPLRIVRACLPTMRAKGSGNILLISSGAGYAVFSLPQFTFQTSVLKFDLLSNSFLALAGRSTYAASKFAIEAVHESLAQEVKTFGIKVLIVEPGAFRTPFSSRIINPAQYKDSNGFSEAYKDTAVAQMVGLTATIKNIEDFAKGDTDKAAKAIVGAVVNGHDYLRLPLGSDCARSLEAKIGWLQSDLDATREIATSTDVD
ncbi:hypothetical protein UA08_03491 [Talaromyces atroroseus]|uniref:Uncharacterized protein n=1 Tax=Talaromyces atroroseus TaxID=1441469 RepID=A0A225B3R2_TALAT|nr:hypothetical protein UA08_03491 [Talaromyces atroroseus]OKL61475.1 hypothetical protein UA08_03491 [Talaromyces atroroseus]